jgi:hypothetical protein
MLVTFAMLLKVQTKSIPVNRIRREKTCLQKGKLFRMV